MTSARPATAPFGGSTETGKDKEGSVALDGRSSRTRSGKSQAKEADATADKRKAEKGNSRDKDSGAIGVVSAPTLKSSGPTMALSAASDALGAGGSGLTHLQHSTRAVASSSDSDDIGVDTSDDDDDEEVNQGGQAEVDAGDDDDDDDDLDSNEENAGGNPSVRTPTRASGGRRSLGGAGAGGAGGATGTTPHQLLRLEDFFDDVIKPVAATTITATHESPMAHSATSMHGAPAPTATTNLRSPLARTGPGGGMSGSSTATPKAIGSSGASLLATVGSPEAARLDSLLSAVDVPLDADSTHSFFVVHFLVTFRFLVSRDRRCRIPNDHKRTMVLHTVLVMNMFSYTSCHALGC
jgi:hypothetical protein